MRFKRENWQPTIGDKYDLVKFGELTFVRPKQKKSTNFQVSSKPCGLESMHYEDLPQPPVFTAGYLGIQASSKYIIEQYRKSKVKGK